MAAAPSRDSLPMDDKDENPSPNTQIEATHHMPTDSMVTVPLSEISEQEEQELRSLSLELGTSSEPTTPPTEASLEQSDDDDTDKPSLFSSFEAETVTDEDKNTSAVLPTTTSAFNGEAEDASQESESEPQPRSRSNTVCSSSSEKSIEVDWESLEKTEKAEAQEEDSEEVSHLCVCPSCHTPTNNKSAHHSTSSTFGAGKQCYRHRSEGHQNACRIPQSDSYVLAPSITPSVKEVGTRSGWHGISSVTASVSTTDD
jgi:hypothetical protein